MGKKLTADKASTPVVNVSEVEGSFFQGDLQERKMVKTQYGDRPLYVFNLEDTDMRVMIKDGKEYKEVKDIEQGIPVAIFAPTMLDRSLSKAAIGDKIKIVYGGMGKSTKKGRSAPHLFDVELV